jgi:mono/diheme cytochrome c family protein
MRLVLVGCWAGFLAFALGTVRAGAEPAAVPAPVAPAPEAQFEKQVRPLLAQHCLSCHGDKAQLSGLRLDTREGALKGGKNGPALVPGQPEKSLLLQAVQYGGKLKMPPTGRLKDDEIAVLTQWVKAGAPFGSAKAAAASSQLWALSPVKRPLVPAVKNKAWVKNPVDAFVLAELERRGLKPSPFADRTTLIRRVSLDLIGLPPTPEEVDAFLNDRSPDAYGKVVDRLLASPHYGERMALLWLDLARYADSDGYHDDTTRLMWRFRDYVINSFNSNKPFNQFTVEQLAGDLLPNATLEQKTASAFNRCGPTSSEGGAIPEEVLNNYAVDRVNTTGGVWLGLTVQCAQCHDHKFDPITAKDYYQLSAFFNQVPEEALYRGTDAPPTLLIPTPEQQTRLDELGRQITALEGELKSCAPPAPPDMAKAAELTKKLDEAKKARAEIERTARLRVMADVPQRRPTYLLRRGDYRTRGEEVQPGVVAALGALPQGVKPDRLALAAWIIDPKNPLPARVTVNRFWQTFWGRGIVKTSEDFGTRGERPSHPELLDWLADEFVRSGWDVKHVVRLMVTGAAYQQSSRVTKELLARDPDNRLLTRGPRFRLPAELIRDNALAISGLLDRDRAPGGPSVKPYQPGDLWRELSAGDQAEKSYVQDHGPDLYRRGLYTFWKRSILYPGFAVFDAPKREVITCRRLATNTPLQAFVTLNDTTYLEAARVLAQRVLQNGGGTPETRLGYAMRLALGRLPTPKERQVLTLLYQDTLSQYRQDREAALKLASVGEAPRPKELDSGEHAAWTCVCNAILNLDETITKE